jgi:hypothetical protein
MVEDSTKILGRWVMMRYGGATNAVL